MELTYELLEQETCSLLYDLVINAFFAGVHSETETHAVFEKKMDRTRKDLVNHLLSKGLGRTE